MQTYCLMCKKFHRMGSKIWREHIDYTDHSRPAKFTKEELKEQKESFERSREQILSSPVRLLYNYCDCGNPSGNTIFAENNACTCGAKKHHWHCADCGKISQIG